MDMPKLLCVVALLLMGVAATERMSIAQDAEITPESSNWRTEPNKFVYSDNHWRWTLRSVQRMDDRLIVTLRFRNNATTARPILLEDDPLSTIILIDEASDRRFPLLSFEGISEQPTAVKRKKSKSATFTFAYPAGASAVRFASNWISMRMGGEASIMEVEFTLDIPSANAGQT
jgi:hypothetical protein|tara:strand:+ start:1700 stop:2221 length:522 start_codon:yes stop_codon:yes gene_type:complete